MPLHRDSASRPVTARIISLTVYIIRRCATVVVRVK
jgi:hypothetical protein